MANILLLDDNEVAGRAMRGILTRGNHRCAVVADGAAAWRFIREHVKVDLLILELKLHGDDGLAFVQRLRGDLFLKNLPIVVYTGVIEQPVVKAALALHVQNYLIKPYHEDSIYAEVAKAGVNPWRNLHFEEEKSFCAQLGLKPEQLRDRRRELMTALEDFRQFCRADTDGERHPEVLVRITGLTESAEAAGVWGVVDYLTDLHGKLEAGFWNELKNCDDRASYAWRLIFSHLNPGHVPEGFISEAERKEKEETQERERWLGADVKQGGPLTDQAQLERLIVALPGCPVIDTVAAAFQMTADGKAASLNQVLAMVAQDPGLTAQVLVLAGKLKREEMTPVEDPRVAVGLLGEIRLNAMAKALPTVEERLMHVPPISWPHFWIFQMAVAQVARFTAHYLQFGAMAATAQTAGMLHDLGKLLLLRIHPYAFQATVAHARKESVPLAEAELRYLGWTSRGMGEYFARRGGLPAVYANVMRWVETPEEATEDAEIVAVVSFARLVCLHNRVGYSGDAPKDSCPPIASTAAWAVLRERVFPSFDLRKFEAEAHTYCVDLRQTLTGRHL
jgi:CheY-like chemotaxis protein